MRPNAAKCQVPSATTAVSRSWLLAPYRCTQVLIAWDTLKLLASLNGRGFLLLFLLLTIYLQKSPGQFVQFLEFLKWSQFLKCQILQVFCWSLSLQRISDIASCAFTWTLWGFPNTGFSAFKESFPVSWRGPENYSLGLLEIFFLPLK